MGVIRSDVVTNGCWDCDYLEGAIESWRLEPSESRTQERVEEIVGERDADERVDVSRRYEHSLDVGSYLACTVATKRSCLFFDVATDELWTLHLRSVFADPPVSLKLYNPAGDQVEVDRFVVGVP